MNRTLTICLSLFLLTPGLAQTTYEDCYRGGMDAFYLMMMRQVKYPQAAQGKGVEGVSIVSYTVDCTNTPIDFQFENTVGYGIEEAIKAGLRATKGSWCDCDIIKDKRFTMSFLFTMSDYSSDQAKIHIKGYYGKPFNTNDLEAKVEKQLSKGKFDKAKEILTILLFKYPENEKYRAWDKEISAGSK